MPRAKDFDVDKVLRKAIGTFWRRGYAVTSMQDLVDCTGINRASLYATYGDKRSLFITALKTYDAQGLLASLLGLLVLVRSRPDNALLEDVIADAMHRLD